MMALLYICQRNN